LPVVEAGGLPMVELSGFSRLGRAARPLLFSIGASIILAPPFARTIALGEENAAESVIPEPAGLWSGPINSAVPATLRGGTVIRNASELAALQNREKVVLIDASNLPKKPEGLTPNSPWIPVPHAAIPNTLWIPGCGMAEIDPEVDSLYRDLLANATGNNLDKPIVVYCHERCWLSYNAARRAIGYGYSNVYWYPDGIEGWRAAGHPTVAVTAIENKPAN
jgi:PQQ-dependent catabolism-associated CXXCW motif protein